MHFSGPLTTTDRDTLSVTGTALAMLPLPGCRELATRLSCLAQTRLPSRTVLDGTLALAREVHAGLLSETSPDRWVDEVAGLPDAHEVIGDLIAQRRTQAAQISDVIGILENVSNRLPATVSPTLRPLATEGSGDRPADGCGRLRWPADSFVA